MAAWLVQVHKKQMKELSELRILQKVEAHDGLIWAMKFSPDGLYLASGGQDKVRRRQWRCRCKRSGLVHG